MPYRIVIETEGEPDVRPLFRLLSPIRRLEVVDLSATASPPPKTRRTRRALPDGVTINGKRVSNVHLILINHYVFGARFTLEAARKWMQQFGYNPNSASPTISDLIAMKLLSRDPNTKALQWIAAPPADLPNPTTRRPIEKKED